MESLERLTADSHDPGLMADVASAYMAVADVQGMPGLASLGHTDKADETYRRACAMTGDLLRIDSRAASPYRRIASVCDNRRGFLLWKMNRYDEARASMQKGLSEILPLVSLPAATPIELRTAAQANTYLAQLEGYTGNRAAARKYSQASTTFMRRYAAASSDPRARIDLARSILVSSESAELDERLPLMKESIALYSEFLRNRPLDVENRRELNIAYLERADVEYHADAPSLGQKEQSLASVRAAVSGFRQALEQDRNNVSAKTDLAEAVSSLALREPPETGQHTVEEAISLMQSTPANYTGRNPDLARFYLSQAMIEEKLKRVADARSALRQAESLQSESNKPESARLWRVRGELAPGPREALAAYTKMWESTPKDTAGDVSIAFEKADAAQRLSQSYAQLNDVAHAAEWKRHAESAWAPWKGKYAATDQRLGF